ncbi:MAG: 7TM diverse intracellular signaling domain-containing protein [Turneriella sp.]
MLPVLLSIALDGFSGAAFIGSATQYLEKDGPLEVVAAEAGWKALGKDHAGLGFHKDPVWLRFKLANSEKTPKKLVLDLGYPLHDHVEFYENDGKRTVKKVSGDMHPYRTREIDSANIAFLLTAIPGEQTHYLRLHSQSSMVLPLRILSEQEFYHEKFHEYVILFLYYGVLIVMALYNLFLFFSIRDRTYLYYTLFTACLLMNTAILNGMAFQFLWPDSPRWGNIAALVAVFLVHALGIQFSRSYLRTDLITPRVDIFLRGFMALCFAGAGAAFFLPYYILMRPILLLVLAATAVLMGVGIYGVVKKSRPAYFYLVAWVMLLAANVLAILKNAGILPSWTILTYSIQIGSAAEVLLLSLGLADRINVLNNQLEAANENLENKVKERTIELAEKNWELAQKNTLMEVELQIAAEIQNSIFPNLSWRKNGIALAGHYRPLEKVGGDYYDVFHHDGWTGIVLADAEGHGVPAALLTAMAKISFSEAVSRSRSPAEILKYVNDSMHKLVLSQGHMTAFFAAITPERELAYANAAHPPAYLLRKAFRQVTPLAAAGFLLGVTDRQGKFELKNESLATGDRLFLFSDGLYDHHKMNDSVIDEAWLQKVLLQSHGLPLDDACTFVLKEWEACVDGAQVQDDVSFLMIEVGAA